MAIGSNASIAEQIRVALARRSRATGSSVVPQGDEPVDGPWRTIIDRLTVEWPRHLDVFAEDGLVPPGLAVLSIVADAAVGLWAAAVPAPQRVAPNGDGGVVLEWSDGDLFESLEFDDTGAIECRSYRDAQLVARERLG